MCVGIVLEHVKVSISGQAGKDRKHRAYVKAQALVNCWKKLLLIMALAISTMPDAEAFASQIVPIASKPKLKVK